MPNVKDYYRTTRQNSWTVWQTGWYLVACAIVRPVAEFFHRQYIVWSERANIRIGRIWEPCGGADGNGDYTLPNRPAGNIEKAMYWWGGVAFRLYGRLGRLANTLLARVGRVPGWVDASCRTTRTCW